MGDTIEEFTMGKSNPTPQHVYDINFGERIASTRELLRRACYVNREVITGNTAGTSLDSYSLIHSKYPPMFGYDPNGIHGAQQINGISLDVPFNYCAVGPFQWLQSCFVGMRGSTIWHYCGLDQFNIPTMRVRRLSTNYYNGSAVTTRSALRNITTSVTGASYSGTARTSITRGSASFGGASLVHQATQTGLSVLYPQYSKFRFVTANPSNSTYGSSVDDTIYEKFVLDAVTANKTGDYVGVDRYFSIGPDFTFFFFLNVPPRGVYTTPTAALF